MRSDRPLGPVLPLALVALSIMATGAVPAWQPPPPELGAAALAAGSGSVAPAPPGAVGTAALLAVATGQAPLDAWLCAAPHWAAGGAPIDAVLRPATAPVAGGADASRPSRLQAAWQHCAAAVGARHACLHELLHACG